MQIIGSYLILNSTCKNFENNTDSEKNTDIEG